MTTVAAPTRYTPADVARLSDQTGKLYELVGGVLVEKPDMSLRSNLVGTRLAFLLSAAYPPDKALIVFEQPTYCFGESGQMRRPDVALVWASRFPNGPTDEELFIPPDFIAEVASPSNKYDELHDRVEEFLQAGVPLGWIIDPRHRFIHVYRNDGSGELYRSGDVIADEPALPGFRLKVADCFVDVPSPKRA